VNLDATAMSLVGARPESYDGRIGGWLGLVHPDDLAMVRGELGEALATREPYEVEYRIRRSDGTTRWLQVRGQVHDGADGSPHRVVGAVWDTTGSCAARDGVRRALRDMGDGFLSLDRQWRITFANVEAERLLAVPGKLTGRVVWDVPVVRAVPDLEARCRATAGRTEPAGFDVEWPHTGRWYAVRLVPVPDGLAWYFTDITERRRHKAERVAAARTSGQRSARIQELTAGLAEAVTANDVVNAVADRVLPPFDASGLVVSSVEAGRLRVVGAVGYPQAFLDMLDGMPLLRDPSVAADLNRHQPWFISSREEYQERYPLMAAAPERSIAESWAFLPLVVSGRLVGLCVVAFDRPRRLNGEERALLIALSGLVAQALERARLYDAEHARAQEFQRALLPRVLPSLPAAGAAARYLPAGRHADVGGDWYDVIPLSADRVALVIGDVMGHGLSQAVTMARLRTAVRTLSNLELPPDEILSHLNDLVIGLGGESFTTCLYAIYDPVTGTCSFARAGHPPLAVVRPDGTTQVAQSTPDPPLGAAEPPFENVEQAVPDGSLLVFYTDGLVEAPGRDMDIGMRHLTRLLRTHHDQSVDRLCDIVADALMLPDQQNADDAALLAVRVHATAPQDVVTWPLPDDPRAANTARECVRDQLHVWRLDHLAATTELVASELVGNVVRHAQGPLHLRLLRSRSLVCEVSDGSITTPRIRRASWSDEGGRGLQLVAALCNRWGTRYTTTGKCIWTEQILP
jgi:PAS domain S-box-containing protein